MWKPVIILGGLAMVLILSECVESSVNQITVQRPVGNYIPPVLTSPVRFSEPIETQPICEKLADNKWLCDNPNNSSLPQQVCSQEDVWHCYDYYSPLPLISEQEFIHLQARSISSLELIGYEQLSRIICSVSMYPTISCNNIYVAQYVYGYDIKDLQVGDIVWFTYDGSDVAAIHRIIFIGEDRDGLYFTAKGDNNPTLWEWEKKVRPYQIKFKIIGRYIG